MVPDRKMIRDSFLDRIHKNLDILILPALFVTINIAFGILNPQKYFTSSNLNAIAFQIPELGLFTFAMMIAMITGGINLSIISTANLTGVLMALCLTRLVPADASAAAMGLYIVLTIIGGLLIAALLGSLNGFIIAHIGASPVLTTIGTMIFYEGITLTLTQGGAVSGVPDMFIQLGNGTLLGIPIPLYIFMLAALLLWYVLRYRPFGRYLFFLGSNDKAVEYSGIDVRAVLIKGYTLSGMYAGLAGIVMLSRLSSANARNGYSYLLLSVLLSVLGGTDPDGGFGKVSTVIVALFTMQALTSGLNQMYVNSYITVALSGVLLLLIIRYRRFAEARKRKWQIKKTLEQGDI